MFFRIAPFKCCVSSVTTILWEKNPQILFLWIINKKMSAFDDAAFEECLANFNTNDTVARNLILVASEDQLRKIVKRSLSRFPGVQRWEDTNSILQECLISMNETLQRIEVNSPADYFRLASRHIRLRLIDLARQYHNLISHYLTPNPNGDAPVLHDVDSSSWDPSILLEWEEFHKAVEQLEDREQQVMGIVFYQGLTQVQASKVLGLTVDQINYSWTKARLQLLQACGGNLPL